MRLRSQVRSLFNTTSVAALSAAAMIGASQPAGAQSTISQAIYTGGSTLASQAFRQLFDCYMGQTVGTGAGADGFSFQSTFTSSPPSPGALPPACLTWTTVATHQVEGLYAGVGSGNGFRGYISDNPDQWYGGNVAVGTISTPFPAPLPPFIDNNNTNFGSYPYPNVDIALSDSPLVNQTIDPTLPATYTTISFTFSPPTGWETTAQIQVISSQTAAYSTTTSWGPAIQVPAFEAGVAIAINTAAPTTAGVAWQIQSTVGLSTPGNAIQLTEGQLCAIFSGLVTRWDDNVTTIPYMQATSPTTGTTITTGNLGYANTINSGPGAGTGAQAYAVSADPNNHLPITVVFRSDGSGTSFILTNFLANLCPLIDVPNANAHGYQQIFSPTAADIAAGYKRLPSTSFSDLVNNINIFRGSGATANFIGATASGGVAATISDGTGQPNNAGYIGYVSADFTNPYAATVTGVPSGSTTPTTVNAPLSASVQNEDLRVNSGEDVPGQGGLTNNFIAPTPIAVENAWGDANIFPTNDLNSTAADWNVYNQLFPGTQAPHGGYVVASTSVLPLTLGPGAYPLSGTTFLALYSCYNSPTRATNLVNFLTWLYAASDSSNPAFDASVSAIIQNNGFHELSVLYAPLILQGYLGQAGGLANTITDAPTNGINGTAGSPTGQFGCTGVDQLAGAN